MSHRSSSSVSRSAQAIWLCFAVALVADLASGSPMSYHHHLSKRFYVEECKGVYDQRIFAKLERICEDCYNVFREPSIHQLCKESCYDSDIFKGCLETLMFSPEEIEEVKDMVKQVKGGAVPPDLEVSVSRLNSSKRVSRA